MDVLIVVLNYRTPDLTIQCLRSLCAEVSAPGSGASVIVVEGGSGDDSGERIGKAIEANAWGGWASVLVLKENRGYAAGNNAAIRVGMVSPDRPRYVLILNPDTLVRAGAVRALVRFMDEHPRAGIAGSQLQDPDGTLQPCAFRFPSVISELEAGLRLGWMSRLLSKWRVAIPPSEQSHQADWVAGASFIVRDQVLDEVGLMDEGYFLYFEEVVFCLRVKRAQWECWHVPASRVVHFIGQSTGVSCLDRRRTERRPAYWFESRRRFFVKRYGVPGLLAVDSMWGLGRVVLLLRKALRLGGDTSSDPRRLTLDLLWGDLKAVFTRRALNIPEIGTRL